MASSLSTLAARGGPPNGGSGLSSGASKPLSELLIKWLEGDASALENLLPLVYDELRRLARYYLQSEREGHTLRIVELRFLAGLSIEATSKLLKLSPATVKRTWGTLACG